MGPHWKTECYLKDSRNLLWLFDLLPITYFNFSASFDRCEDSFCSEKEVEYSASMPQLKLLLEKSPSCVQEVKFDCQLAPIVVSFILENIYRIILMRLTD